MYVAGFWIIADSFPGSLYKQTHTHTHPAHGRICSLIEYSYGRRYLHFTRIIIPVGAGREMRLRVTPLSSPPYPPPPRVLVISLEVDDCVCSRKFRKILAFDIDVLYSFRRFDIIIVSIFTRQFSRFYHARDAIESIENRKYFRAFVVFFVFLFFFRNLCALSVSTIEIGDKKIGAEAKHSRDNTYTR